MIKHVCVKPFYGLVFHVWNLPFCTPGYESEKFDDSTDTINDFISLWFGFISAKLCCI